MVLAGFWSCSLITDQMALAFLGSCFSLNSSAGPRIPVPGCAALGPAWARHGRFVPLGVSNLGRQGAEGAASPGRVGRRRSPARARFEGSVCSTEHPGAQWGFQSCSGTSDSFLNSPLELQTSVILPVLPSLPKCLEIRFSVAMEESVTAGAGAEVCP